MVVKENIFQSNGINMRSELYVLAHSGTWSRFSCLIKNCPEQSNKVLENYNLPPASSFIFIFPSSCSTLPKCWGLLPLLQPPSKQGRLWWPTCWGAGAGRLHSDGDFKGDSNLSRLLLKLLQARKHGYGCGAREEEPLHDSKYIFHHLGQCSLTFVGSSGHSAQGHAQRHMYTIWNVILKACRMTIEHLWALQGSRLSALC